MLDCVIRGGTVVDGTGAPGAPGRRRHPRRPDRRDRRRSPRTRPRPIDAGGLVVAPGIVDPHTHYDAQLFWDPAASPSNLHGVTSMIAGNCGFTLAPIAPADADYLRRMMAKVEGMPLPALETGVPWNWRTFADYLGALDGSVALNVGFLVGHCALRRNVMGADSVGNEATPDAARRDHRACCTTRSTPAVSASPRRSRSRTPTATASRSRRVGRRNDEVLALCRAVSEHEGTTLEYVTDGCLRGFTDAEVELMAEMTLAGPAPAQLERAHDRLAGAAALPRSGRGVRERAARGGTVIALTMPILVEMNMSFLNYCALFMMPGWSDVMNLPVPERIAKLRDPEVRKWMDERARSPEAGVFSRLASWGRYMIGDTFSAANEGLKGQVVADLAQRSGQDRPSTRWSTS